MDRTFIVDYRSKRKSNYFMKYLPLSLDALSSVERRTMCPFEVAAWIRG